MTLGFSRTWGKEMGELAGMPTYFIQGIWLGLIELDLLTMHDMSEYAQKHFDKFGKGWDIDYKLQHPKIHTMRYDPHHRWKPGRKIHFVINNRTKNRFQFAPIINCTDTQEVLIKNYKAEDVFTVRDLDGIPMYGYDWGDNYSTVSIDGRPLNAREIWRLARNDGFGSVESLLKFFNKPVNEISLIHWVNVKY